ncbi:MAG TPA: amino acid adenylation domain-containing protein [Herpetosiphonaceae bacterium]
MTNSEQRLTRRAQLSPERQALLEQWRRGSAPSAPVAAIPRRADDGPARVSFGQQRFWFLDQLEPGNTAYNVPLHLRLTGPLDITAMERALTAVMERHAALRTTFDVIDGELRQIVAPAAPVTLPLVDVQHLAGEERAAEARRLAIAELRRPFDLQRDLPLRASLLRLSADEHVLLLVTHHIVFDGSHGIFFRDLAALYNAATTGSVAQLPQLTIEYPDFAEWQRQWLQGEILDQQLSYWKERLAGERPVLQLPSDRPRPPMQSFRGAKQSITFPAGLGPALKALSQQEGVTLFMTGLAAFLILLHRHSGQQRLLVGTPVAHRNRPEIEHLLGCLVNTLVLSVDMPANPRFRELLRLVRETVVGAHSRQDLPFEMLVEALQPSRNLSYNPIYQVMFGLQHASVGGSAFTGLHASALEVDSGTSRLDILLHMWDGGDRLTATMEYNSDLFDAATIARMLRQLQTILMAVVADPELRVWQTPLLSDDERHEMLDVWNATRRDYERDICMHHLFERQVLRQPDAPAALFGDTRLSYRELNQQANQIAHQLLALGVGRGSMVAIVMERSLEMIPALLGVLKAGATYVPLEVSFPRPRVQWILSTLGVRCVLTQSAYTPTIDALLPELPALEHVVLFDTSHRIPLRAAHTWTQEDLQDQPEANPEVAVSADDLAYVIFTSGSTGTPKGVMVRHQPVINLIEWITRSFDINPSDRVLFVTSLCFDLSVYDVFGLLAAGGSIRIASERELRDPDRLVQILRTEPITFWDSAPAALQQLTPLFPKTPIAQGEHHLRLVFLSGDWIPVTLPDLVRTTFAGANVISLGGATEATVWSNYYPIGAVERQWLSIPYGRPIQNARYYVLDRYLNPCPIGVPGELHIGDECLALGYAQEPILTATKFIPDPFSHPEGTRPGARLYKTGDQARFWADGTIEFLGRIDHQVKIRGFRIELGEIETVLREHPGVREAIVVAHTDQPSGAPWSKRLVAYVLENQERAPSGQSKNLTEEQGNKGTKEQSTLTPLRLPPTRRKPAEEWGKRLGDEGLPPEQPAWMVCGSPLDVAFPPPAEQPEAHSAKLDPRDLRSFVHERLPEYMVPSAFVVLDTLPVTANGKVDRKALPVPEHTREELDQPHVAPRTPIEQALAEVWSRILRVESIGVHDNFFLLGGHSLTATQVTSFVRETYHVDIALRTLFEEPTIASLARLIAQAETVPLDTPDEHIQPIPVGEKTLEQLLAEIEGLSDDEALDILGQPGL